MRKKGLLATVGLLMMANFLVKIFGLLREVILAKYYGVTIYTDAYIIANNIPTVLFAAIGTALSTVFVPMYSKVRQEEGEQKANTFTLHLLVVICVVCIAAIGIGELFTKQIVIMFASGFKGETLEITISFARILFPSVLGIALMNIFGSYLQAHGKFVPFVMVPIVGNLTIIISMFISAAFEDIYILVWGTLGGLLAQIVFYVPWVWISGIFNGKWKGILSDKYLLQLLPLVLPVFLGEAVNEINTIVDRTLVTGLETGSVSALNYAYKIIGIVVSVVCGSMTTLLYPELSKLSAEKEWKKLSVKSEEALSALGMILVPVVIVVFVFSKDIVKILFGRGNFGENAIIRTSIALLCYAVAIIGIGLRDIMVKLFCSMQNTRVPMVNGTICAGLNIVLDIILIRMIGFRGAAIATALAAVFGAFNMIRIARKKEIITLNRFYPNLLKNIIGGGMIYIFMYLSKKLLEKTYDFGITYLGLCSLSILIAVAIYFLSQVLLKNEILGRFLARKR